MLLRGRRLDIRNKKFKRTWGIYCWQGVSFLFRFTHLHFEHMNSENGANRNTEMCPIKELHYAFVQTIHCAQETPCGLLPRWKLCWLQNLRCNSCSDFQTGACGLLQDNYSFKFGMNKCLFFLSFIFSSVFQAYLHSSLLPFLFSSLCSLFFCLIFCSLHFSSSINIIYLYIRHM